MFINYQIIFHMNNCKPTFAMYKINNICIHVIYYTCTYIHCTHIHPTHTPFPFFLPRNLNCSHAKLFAVQKVSRFILFSSRCLPHSPRELYFSRDISNISYETFCNHTVLRWAEWRWTLTVCSSLAASETLRFACWATCPCCFSGLTVFCEQPFLLVILSLI